MSATKRIPVWAIVLMALLGANLSWMTCLVYLLYHAQTHTGNLALRTLTTNDVSGWPLLIGNVSATGVVETKTGQPKWARWNCDPNGNAGTESLLFQGEKVFDIYWTNNQPPVYNVYFRGPGSSVTWWHNRAGAPQFTQRTVYDTNGLLCSNEVLFGDAWHAVDRRNGRNGIALNGQWHPLALQTNGMWMIEAPVEPDGEH